MNVPIKQKEFQRFRDLLYDLAGIHLSDAKKALVSGRLGKRLRHYGLESFDAYYKLVTGGDHPEERQIMLDLLTTNETYFFREEKHFDYLGRHILPAHRGGEFRAWSAACSSGQEPYTLAMVLQDHLGEGWSILGTDISSRVLERARQGIYPMAEAQKIPSAYLRRYCLKGVRSREGTFLVGKELKKRVTFRQFNLNQSWSGLDRFHLIFLRNVMIYFDQATKARLVERIAHQLVPGGHLIIGHSESLNGVTDRFATVMPSIYRLK